MSERPLLLSDLDDTLFQSRRKTAGDGRTVATAGTGDPAKASLMTPRQTRLFDWLHQAMEIIPVTARSGAAFDRVALPFSSWAILSNGALIRSPEGTPDPHWQAQMTATLTPLAPIMEAILSEGSRAARAAGLDTRAWIVTEAGLATYVVFKLNQGGAQAEAALGALDIPLGLTGWTRHVNSGQLALIPPGSGKAAAATWLLARIGAAERLTFSYGDSLSDLPFMALADAMLVPPGSQIARAL